MAETTYVHRSAVCTENLDFDVLDFDVNEQPQPVF